MSILLICSVHCLKITSLILQTTIVSMSLIPVRLSLSMNDPTNVIEITPETPDNRE